VHESLHTESVIKALKKAIGERHSNRWFITSIAVSNTALISINKGTSNTASRAHD
jgi:hypothetical protein